MSEGVDFNVASTPIDVDTDTEEDVEEWQTALPKSRKKKVLMKFKETPSFGKKGELERRYCFQALP